MFGVSPLTYDSNVRFNTVLQSKSLLSFPGVVGYSGSRITSAALVDDEDEDEDGMPDADEGVEDASPVSPAAGLAEAGWAFRIAASRAIFSVDAKRAPRSGQLRAGSKGFHLDVRKINNKRA